MTQEDFQVLVERAGLNLLSKYAPRFLVSLRIPTDFGIRRQCGRLDFASVEAFSMAQEDEIVQSLDTLKRNLLRASGTKSGDIGAGMVVTVKTKQIVKQEAIKYPAH